MGDLQGTRPRVSSCTKNVLSHKFFVVEKERREEKGREGCVTVACCTGFTWRAYLVDVTAAVVKLIARCITKAGRRFPRAVGRVPLTAGGVVGSNA